MEFSTGLDMTNAKGLGLSDYDNNLPSEHGKRVDENDIQLMMDSIADFNIVDVPGMLRNHRFLTKIKKGNKSTVIFIPGGIGYCFVVGNCSEFPKKLIFPMALIPHWPSDINLIVVDMDHSLGWSWTTESNFHLINIDKQKRDYLIGKKFPGQWTTELIEAFHDIYYMSEYFKKITDSDIWLAGHCSSCEILARYHDYIDSNHISGLIFANPLWVKYRYNPLHSLKYFYKPVEVPLLVIQHEQDRNINTSKSIANRVIEVSCSTRSMYVGLSGGIDQGLPHFSLGHHGFRGIEIDMVSAIEEFIKT